jgi:uncharacterized protein
MICPNCQTQFHTVQAKSHYGANIKIDQCPNCGGIWCNSLDMASVSPEEAQRIDKLDIGKLSSYSAIKKDLHCPKCNNILQNFKDPSFPQQIRLSFCSKCMGFWLNRGELAEYKKWQNIKTAKPRNTTSEDDQKLKKQMDFFLAGAKENNYEALGSLGNLLNQQATCNVVYKNDSLPVAAEILLNMVGWIFLGMY